MSTEASAIVIRDDVPESQYRVDLAEHPEFRALVDLFEPGDCIGTLVHESYLITAAHCAVELSAGTSLEIAGASHQVAEVILHPMAQPPDDPEYYDIALIRVSTPVTSVAPFPLHREAGELGESITLVGRGTHATGLVGEPGGTVDAVLRMATNVVSSVDEHYLEITFERPGEAGITDLEGVGASGDSGCPAFIEVGGVLYIAGVNSWGDGDDAGVAVAQYGAKDYQSRVSQYLGFLDAHIPSGGTPAPSDAGTGGAVDAGMTMVPGVDSGAGGTPAPTPGIDAGPSAAPGASDGDAGGCSASGGFAGSAPQAAALLLLVFGLVRRRRVRFNRF